MFLKNLERNYQNWKGLILRPKSQIEKTWKNPNEKIFGKKNEKKETRIEVQID